MGSSGREVGRPLGVGSGERNFLNFQVKSAGFYAFLLRKTILEARNRDQGRLNRSMGAENVKCTEDGVENLAQGFNFPTPRQLAP